MADVTTYTRCIVPHARGATIYGYNEIRATSDASVTQNPAFWQALTDVQMASGKWILTTK
jgi:hypothetical protein